MEALISSLPDELYFQSTAANGFGTWSNLVLLSQLLVGTGPLVLVFDTTNDTLLPAAFSNAYIEAYLRRVWTYSPDTRFISMNFFQVANPLVDDPTALNQAMINRMKVICTHYAVSVVDYQAEITNRIANGDHLVTYFIDNTHPTLAGHAVATELLRVQFPGNPAPGVLPARLFPDSVDFEFAPLIKVGTDFDARAGVWVDTGTRTESNVAGSTITYSGTFRSFGCFRADNLINDVDVSIDAGAFADINFWQCGYDIGARAAHVIVIRVTTQCRIDEFWAI
jgi:hypothetical protein